MGTSQRTHAHPFGFHLLGLLVDNEAAMAVAEAKMRAAVAVMLFDEIPMFIRGYLFANQLSMLTLLVAFSHAALVPCFARECQCVHAIALHETIPIPRSSDNIRRVLAVVGSGQLFHLLPVLKHLTEI